MGLFDVTGWVDSVKGLIGSEADKKTKRLDDGLQMEDKTATGQFTGLTDAIAEAKKYKAELKQSGREGIANAVGLNSDGTTEDSLREMAQAVDEYFS